MALYCEVVALDAQLPALDVHGIASWLCVSQGQAEEQFTPPLPAAEVLCAGAEGPCSRA